MAHPNNLDRCRKKYLMHNIVSHGVWWWLVGTCAILALGKLLEDQQELMLRRKPGAKTHCVSHRLLLQHLPILLREIEFPPQGKEIESGHGCPLFCADAVP